MPAEARAPDANDAMYQWNASRDFDPTPDLGKIEAALLVINSEDDERNPPELDTLANGMAAIGHGEVYIIPASDQTQGHGTTGSQVVDDTSLDPATPDIHEAVRAWIDLPPP